MSQTIARAHGAGLEIKGFPLFEVRPAEWSAPDDLAFDGILIGSANAIRHGGPQLALLLDLPVYAVGETTAETAQDAGFTIADIGQGGLQSLLDKHSGKAIRFLRLAGRDHVELSPPRSHTIVDRVVYQSDATEMSPQLGEALLDHAVVLLHSAGAAAHFANECSRVGVDRGAIRIAALGPRVAAACGEGWGELQCADQPSDAALLALTKNMCK
ncbi:uroporphyrinogen-III synthase [Pontixanthobacter aquaemixtae]|uniref:uroporphyrinogen-III synthase n=1 Tax=Pontixanthobacter aquaemixtae TaxID=1958940 RepID=UPI001F31A09B|nr:uroporphyrinogen-III synthase [Pontixanthobacter aquaemixtae]